MNYNKQQTKSGNKQQTKSGNNKYQPKPLIQVIKEELNKFYTIEGVADKYAEKEFNIPDSNRNKEIKAISNIKPDNNDNAQTNNIVGIIDDMINVYLNPKNLDDFEKNVKAISIENGDFFVAQFNSGFFHDEIIRAVNNGGVYDTGLNNVYDEEFVITWIRIFNTNDFGFSASYNVFGKNNKNKPIVDKLISAAKQKNYNFNFIPEYCENLKQLYREKNSAYTTISNPNITNPATSTNISNPVPVTNLYENIIYELENLISNNSDDKLMNKNNMVENIDVWHGSTEKFDDFNLEKIGSGDGKSLGGWGIYFSDSPEVSQRYYLPKGQLKQHEIRKGKYFDFDEPLENGQTILNGLTKVGVSDNDLEEFQETYADNYDTNGKQVYDWLTYVLGGEKEASMFLESLGYIGNTMMDRWEIGARNYVVFNPKSIIQ